MKEKLISFYRALGWEARCLVAASVLSLIPITALSVAPKPEKETSRPLDVVTKIPKGFVLVPIEVRNFEVVDSILGPYGFVDLIRPAAHPGANPSLVARNVRVLRAPHNPSHFAVLIREREVDRVLGEGSEFVLVIKRPNEAGTEFVINEKNKRRRIVYEGGNP